MECHLFSLLWIKITLQEILKVELFLVWTIRSELPYILQLAPASSKLPCYLFPTLDRYFCTTEGPFLIIRVLQLVKSC